MQILHIDSSINGINSVSRRLSAAVVCKARDAHPGARIIYRDLAAQPLAYFDGTALAAVKAGKTAAALQPADIFMDADITVVGAPMYNYGIPAQLKSWVDYLAIPGVTFRYTAQGPEGLATGRRVIVCAARGGLYRSETPAAHAEHQESYLRATFGLFGIEIEVIRAEGMRMGPEMSNPAIAAAERAITGLAF